MSATNINNVEQELGWQSNKYISITSYPAPQPGGGTSDWKYVYKTSYSEGKVSTVTTQRISSVTPNWNNPAKRPFPPPNNNFTFVYERRPLATGWRREMRQGSISPSVAPVNTTIQKHGRGLTLVPAPATLLSDSEITAEKNRLKIKILNKIKNQSVNLRQTYAERKQTVDLVTKSAMNIASAMRSLRKGDIASAAGALGIVTPKRAGRRFNKSYVHDQSTAIANGWLALQYGWKPLLGEVYGACETLARANNNVYIGHAKVSGKLMKQVNTQTNLLTSPDHVGSRNDTVSGEEICHITMCCTYGTSNEVLASLKEVGITNPLLLAWELLPYSFVADWFLPVGSWLSTLDATNGLTFKTGYTTTYRKCSSSATRAESFYNKSGTSEGISVMGREDSRVFRVSVQRSVFSTFPDAPPPAFKNPMSLTHLANAMALLRTSFK